MKLEDRIRGLKDDLEPQKFPAHLDQAFANKLKEELHTPQEKQRKTKQLIYWAVGIAAVLAIVFQVLNFENTAQTTEFNNMVNTLSSTNQATEQLETINTLQSNFSVKDDSRFVHALVTIVQENNSPNVKVTAINTLLEKYADKELVRTGLLQALEKETEPLVQIKLIKTLTILKEARAQRPLEQIIANRENVSAVRNSAQLAMTNLKNQYNENP